MYLQNQDSLFGVFLDQATSLETQDVVRGSSKVVECKRWIKIALFTMFVFSGQAVATMLGRLYFKNEENSKWMATLVQTIGFPLMLPLIFLYLPSKTTPKPQEFTTKPSWITLFMLYMFLGIFLAADCML